jgi:hypothetical protein
MKTLITFDYELFSGSNPGSVENSLIKPTERLRQIAKQYDVKFVFFVDILYLLKAKEIAVFSKKVDEDFKLIVGQLFALSADGHDLELHIHPQWYYSSFDFDSNHWIIDMDHFKISDCPREDVELMITEAVNYLTSIKQLCHHSNAKYGAISYRAGGYSFPNEQWFYDLLKRLNIKIDSSVLLASKDDSKYQHFDYSMINTPNTYKFENNLKKEDKNGYFWEIPISGVKIMSLFYCMETFLLRLLHKKDLIVCGDGVGIKSSRIGRKYIYINRFLMLFKGAVVHASIDGTSGFYLSYIYNWVKRQSGDVFVVIAHPKTQNEYGLKCLSTFLSKYSAEVRTTDSFM